MAQDKVFIMQLAFSIFLSNYILMLRFIAKCFLYICRQFSSKLWKQFAANSLHMDHEMCGYLTIEQKMLCVQPKA